MSEQHHADHHSDRGADRPRHSEPHVGHGGTKFEGVDASLKLVGLSLAAIAGMLVIVFALVVGLQKYLYDTTPLGQPASPLGPGRVVPPNPQLQVHPWEEFPDLRADEDRVLNGSGKDADGHAHIPIDQALNGVVSSLEIRPDAPLGITTPGGEGRDFSGSVNAMPAPYRRPQIQGEIHKNAKQ